MAARLDDKVDPWLKHLTYDKKPYWHIERARIGDSREVPLEYVPYYQKAIARRANRWNRSVFVATNLLESMITNKQPTIAEANDIANTLLDGVNGLVLAAETAIGMDPVGSVEMVQRAIDAFERTAEGNLLPEDRPSEARL